MNDEKADINWSNNIELNFVLLIIRYKYLLTWHFSKLYVCP